MHKKTLYLLLFILIGSAVVLIGYIIGARGERNLLSTSGGANISRFVKPQETKAPYDLLDKLPSEKVSYPKLSLDGRSIIYYDASSGYLHKIELSETGNKSSALQKIKPYLQNLSWSWDRKLLLAYDGADHTVYDLVESTGKEINHNILNPVFSAFGDKSAYLWHDPELNTSDISVADTKFEIFINLLSARDKNWKIAWAGKETLSLEYKNGNSTSLFTLDTENQKLTRLIDSKEELKFKWSSSGSALLYSYRSAKDVLLSYRDLVSEKEYQILQATPASKCTWSIDNTTFYCAINKGFNDGFFVFNTKNQSLKTLKTDTSIKTKAEDLFLSADEKYLFFRNSFDTALYRLKIELVQ